MATKEPGDRLPPHNEEAEMCVLGSLLLDNACFNDVIQILGDRGAACFYTTANQTLYQACVDLYDRTQATDLVLLREELEKRRLLEKVGGVEYLMRVVESVPSAANAEHYAQIVREKSMLRDLIRASNEIQRMAYENTSDAALLLDRAEAKIFELTQTGMTRQAVAIEEILKETFDRIDKFHDRKNAVTGIPTGFADLDNLTSGLQDAEFIILAARPSVGKTALALNIAEYVAIEAKLPLAVFSMEMSNQEIGQRLLCSRARVDSHKMRTGFLSEDEWPKLSLAVGELSESKMFIDDTPGLSALELRAKARRLKAQQDIRLVVIDYIQLMEARRGENRQQEISEISRGIKALARELNVPVLALSQLNRAPEAREGGEPRLSDLRESGSLEQDADVVMLLHRKIGQRGEQAGAETAATDTDLIVAKQRNGPTGRAPLTFLPNYVRFGSRTQLEEPEPF